MNPRNSRLIRDENGKVIDRRLIKATNINNGYTATFRSQSEAARVLGLKQQNISSCLHGVLKKTGQWRFEYTTWATEYR
jgi:hypothetical protein